MGTHRYGKPFQASRFAHSLRSRLWQRHLGVHGAEGARLTADPGSEEALSLWNSVARCNTEAFRELFRCKPDDAVTTFESARAWEAGASSRSRAPHESMEELQRRVRGHLVEFPLRYLENERLSPKWSEPAGLIVPMQLVT